MQRQKFYYPMVLRKDIIKSKIIETICVIKEGKYSEATDLIRNIVGDIIIYNSIISYYDLRDLLADIGLFSICDDYCTNCFSSDNCPSLCCQCICWILCVPPIMTVPYNVCQDFVPCLPTCCLNPGDYWGWFGDCFCHFCCND